MRHNKTADDKCTNVASFKNGQEGLPICSPGGIIRSLDQCLDEERAI